MIGTQSVKQALHLDVAISDVMAEALQLWSQMYTNASPWLSKDIKSLNLPAAVAGEIARAATIEMKVEFTGSARAVFLQKQFERILPKLRQQIEYGCAKGGLVMKPYISGDGIAVDFVQADMFFPISFDSDGDITSIVFADQRQAGDRFYTRLEFHQATPAGVNIRNLAFRSTSKDNLGQQCPLSEVADWAELLPEATVTGVSRPLYAYFRYPLANTIDPTSPLGVSCYSRAVDLIKNADGLWSDLLWEFESGRRALYADVIAFGKDADGNPILPYKRLYRALNGSSSLDANPEGLFHEWTPTFREENILNGLEAALKRIEFVCGLAAGTLSDPNQVDKTATEIAASKQRSQATITDTQKAIRSALEQLIWAMDVWAGLGQLAPKGTYAVAFEFDDSLIVDSEAQFSQDSRTVGMGAMPKYQFLVRNYGLTEEVARKWIAETQAEQPKDLFADTEE
ncbi:MAG TPA: phage portal protein [Anaerolineaceae bacterium]|nr:phage portal protein [Anaerolineaceae bacterium]